MEVRKVYKIWQKRRDHQRETNQAKIKQIHSHSTWSNVHVACAKWINHTPSINHYSLIYHHWSSMIAFILAYNTLSVHTVDGLKSINGPWAYKIIDSITTFIVTIATFYWFYNNFYSNFLYFFLYFFIKFYTFFILFLCFFIKFYTFFILFYKILSILSNFLSIPGQLFIDSGQLLSIRTPLPIR